MRKLQLKNPTGALRKPSWVVEVALRTPVAHLDKEYSYCLDEDLGKTVCLGSMVRIPFAGGSTFGFVTEKRAFDEIADKAFTLKFVEKKLGHCDWFDTEALRRFRRIAESYGVSLFTILNLAIPKSVLKMKATFPEQAQPFHLEPQHLRYIKSIYGDDWQKEANVVLQVGPGALWERIAASLLLSDSAKTLLLVPTENHLDVLAKVLQPAQIPGLAFYSSSKGADELAATYQAALTQKLRSLIGLRSAALLPFNAERVIVLEPFDRNYQERRAPYYRADDTKLWEVKQKIFLVHAPSIQILASKVKIFKNREVFERNRSRVFSITEDNLIETLRREIKQGKEVFLLSVNDKSYSSALLCNFCKNRAHCSCGFPFAQLSRSGKPFCSKCNRYEDNFACRHCGSIQLVAIRSGGRKWESLLGSNIKGSRIILSNSFAPKREIVWTSDNEPLIVIATRGMEPRILNQDGSYRGYDSVAILGALQSFNNHNFRDVDEFRNKVAAIRSLLRIKQDTVGNTYIDIPNDHSELKSLASGDYSQFLAGEIKERKELNLPPYSIIAEIKGSEEVLLRLKEFLRKEDIFSTISSQIYEISGHDEECTMMLQVAREDRVALLSLLSKLLKLRSSKSLPLFKYRLDPESL